MENLQKELEKLKDIKPNVAIDDNSLYLLIAIIAAVLMLIIIAYFIFKPKRKRKPTKKELAFKRLKEIDLNNSKEALYRVSIDGAMFVNESNKRLFEEIERDGVEYKYKKETKELSKDLRQKIESFISSIKLERKDDK